MTDDLAKYEALAALINERLENSVARTYAWPVKESADAITELVAMVRNTIKESDTVCDSYAKDNQRLFDRAEASEQEILEAHQRRISAENELAELKRRMREPDAWTIHKAAGAFYHHYNYPPQATYDMRDAWLAGVNHLLEGQ